MKTTPNPPRKPKRLSVAELLHIYAWGDIWTLRRVKNKTSLPCVVIHNLPARQARTLARFANMTEGEQVEALRDILLWPHTDTKHTTRSILSALGLLSRQNVGITVGIRQPAQPTAKPTAEPCAEPTDRKGGGRK